MHRTIQGTALRDSPLVAVIQLPNHCALPLPAPDSPCSIARIQDLVWRALGDLGPYRTGIAEWAIYTAPELFVRKSGRQAHRD